MGGRLHYLSGEWVKIFECASQALNLEYLKSKKGTDVLTMSMKGDRTY